ncbi:MAG: hypothetical protein ACTHLE_03585 [Agriterribacter sp.]
MSTIQTPRLSLPQYKTLTCRKPLQLAMAGQRGGKSFGIGYRSGMYVKYFPKMIGMIAANTYKQLTQSTMVEVRRVWKNNYGYLEYDRNRLDGVYTINKKPPAHFKIFHEFDDYNGIICFRNGAVIFTASLDNYLAHDGKTLGWAELDETKDTKEQAVKHVILARLSQAGLYSDEDGNLLYWEPPTPDENGQLPKAHQPFNSNWVPYNPCVINTSPAEGVVDWLVDLFELNTFEEDINDHIFDPGKFFYKEYGNKAACIYSTYWNAHNLPSNYIQKRLDELTKEEADKFVFGYPFSKTGGEYYGSFDRRQHVVPTPFLRHKPVHLTYDFNVLPYMTLVCVQINETDDELQLRIFKEYCLKPPRNTTEDVTAEFLSDHIGDVKDIFYYGDAMGNRRIEGFGDDFTRFDPVRDVLRYIVTRSSDRTATYNQGVLKRRVLVNKIFSGKMKFKGKTVRIMIDPGCIEMIRDFQYLKLGMDGKLKEKVKDAATGATWEKLGHTSDAFEYMLCYLFSDFL